MLQGLSSTPWRDRDATTLTLGLLYIAFSCNSPDCELSDAAASRDYFIVLRHSSNTLTSLNITPLARNFATHIADAMLRRQLLTSGTKFRSISCTSHGKRSENVRGNNAPAELFYRPRSIVAVICSVVSSPMQFRGSLREVYTCIPMNTRCYF